MIMSAHHITPGLVRINLICLLIILAQQISLGFAQDECRLLSSRIYNRPEGNYTGEVLATVQLTTTEAHSFTLTPQPNNPNVLVLTHNTSSYSILIQANLDAENVVIIKYDLCCSYGSAPPVDYEIRLTVTDVNDNSPVFHRTLSTNIDENLLPGSEVYKLQGEATDADKTGNDVRYEITALDSGYANKFQISGSNSVGKIMLNSSLDYETGPRQYLLIVTARDSATDQRSTTATLTINVRDVDDQNPVFNQAGGYIWHVDENTTLPTFSVSAYDPDIGIQPPVAIKYRLPSGGNIFSINPDSGQITLLRPLDREQNETIFLFVQAYQEDKPDLRVTSTLLEVQIQDINDNPPVLSSLSYSTSILENTAAGVVVLQVSAVDADQGVNSLFEYVMIDETNNAFLINPSTGAIIVNNASLLDADDVQTKRFQFKVFAKESQSTLRRQSQTANVTITLTDVNDNSPVFFQRYYEFWVNETVQRGEEIGRVYASDGDSGDNGKIMFAREDVESPAYGLFSVQNVTGQLFVEGRLTVQTYILFVSATDQAKTEAKRSATARVLVHVEDVNNHSPHFISQQRSFNVTEGVQNFQVTNLQVVDEDINSTLRCDEILGDTSNSFIVYYSSDRKGCIIEATGGIDRETFPDYTLVINVTDGLFTEVTQLYIQVIDVNDNSPQFSQSSYRFNITEGSYTDRSVGQVTATDGDEGRNKEISYTFDYIRSGWFINEDSGQISFSGILDAEEQQSFELLVEARDLGEPSLINLTRVQIMVQDVNDNVPKFLDKFANLWIREDATKGLIYIAQATDNDVTSKYSQALFTVSNGDSELFGITEDGRLFTKSRLVGQESRSYNLTLEVYNQWPYINETMENDTMVVYLKLLDVENKSPVFTERRYRFSVEENSSPQTIVGIVRATDGDSTAENRIITYNITGGNEAGFFRLDSSSGQITVINAIDYEPLAVKNVTLTITATNENLPATSNGTTSVIISIHNINDEAPTFNQSIYNWNITEGNTMVPGITVYAYDLDSPKVTYKFFNNNSVPFSVNPDTGVVQLTRPLNFEHEKRFDAVVAAVDHGMPELTGTALIKVNVQNVNEPPEILDVPIVLSVRENEPVNTRVGWLTVLDRDRDNITIHLSNTTDFHLSSMDRISDTKVQFGLLTSKVFDYERNKNFSFTVEYTDGNTSPVVAAPVRVTVIVTDANDNSPVFTKTLYTGSVEENNQRRNNCLVQVKANDDDSEQNGDITFSNYSIVTGAESGVFRLCENNTIPCVCVEQPLDFETRTEYQLLLKATDNGSPPREGYTEVEIHVLDRNDESPVFSQPVYTAQVPEELAPHDILMVSASDKDTPGLNFSVVSSSFGDPAIFEFRGQQLVLKTVLDREDPSLRADGNIMLNVTVSDGLHYSYARVDLNVMDSNDNTPQFHGQLRKNVARNFAPGTNILQVNVTDDDPTNAGFTYFLSDSDGIFKINSTNGVISLTKSPSTSEKFEFQFTVFVTDHGSPPRLNQTNVVVSINESNHFQPKFNMTEYMFNITENEPADIFVGTVLATDGDGTDKAEGTIQYRLLNQDVPFTVNHSSGEIHTSNSTNREDTCQYQFKIIAIDQGANPRSSEVSITVYINDENDNIPKFENISSSVTVASNSIDRHLFTASATDLDCLPHCDNTICSLNYSIADVNVTLNQGSFRIDQSGQVFVNYLRNSTIGKYIMMIVTASDGTNAVQKSFTVFVYYPGEVPKVDKPGSVTLQENGPNGQLIVDLNATIGTKSADECLQYSISPTSDPHKQYDVNSSTGIVTAKPLDYEQSQHDSIEVSILAMINCEGPNSQPNPLNRTSVQVEVNVEDVDDEAPKFEKSNYYQDLSEGTPVGSTIKSVTASDRDTKEAYKTFTFSIDPSTNVNGTFAINSSGAITLRKRLNIQSRSEYNLTLVATGVHNASLIGRAQLYIRVLDVNDNSPKFSRSSYQFSVEEDYSNSSALGRFVGKVTATDSDQGSNGEFSYSLTYQSYPDVFSISQTGNITTAHRLDRENIDQYILIISAEDNGSPSREGTCTVTVDVTDVNDNAPQLNTGTYQGSVPENVNDGRAVVIVPSISVTDYDRGLFGEESVILELTGDGSELFEVRNLSVYVQKSNHSQLDRETKSVYNLKLKAVDEYGQGHISSSADLRIRVTDVNDLEPQFDQDSYQFNVRENSGGTVVGTVNASDYDLTEVIRYDIISGGDRRFYINPLSGEIRVLDGLDREIRGKYVLNVTAWDGVFEPTVEVTITVLDENDNAPYFTSLPYNFDVPEEMVNAYVGQVIADDADQGLNGEVYYQLINEDKFNINSSSGEIYTEQALDREQQSLYRLVVMAIDKGNSSRSTNTTVTITLIDINDNRPRFLPENITRLHASILEKTPKDSVIAWPRAEDVDQGVNAALTFSLSGPGKEYFSIDEHNGLVTVQDRIDLNTLISKGYISSNTSDTNATLIITVTVNDGGNPSRHTTIPLQIDVEGINDLAPQFSQTTYRFNSLENTPAGELVGYLELRITTLNSTQVAPDPHYTIVDTHGVESHFTVERLNSSLASVGNWLYGSVIKTTNNTIDYETETEFTLIIRAGDGKVPERSAYAVVIVSVEDVNDNSPICPKSALRFSVSENQTSVPYIGSVSATDSDSCSNGELLYYLVNNSTDDLEIDSVTGIISAEYPLDREEESEYDLTVLVRDNGTVSRNCTVPVIILVTDVNDNAPVFYGSEDYNGTYEASVKEDATPGTLVFQVYANDTDVGLNGTVFYSLDPTTNDNFFIHPKDGKLFTLGNLDFETVTSYNLTVLAYDLGFPQQTSQSLVLITVLDVEDTQVLQSLYELFISGKTTLHSVIGTIQSTEQFYFNITGGNDEGTFSISPDNGQITLVKPPGVRSTPFNLTVMATNYKSPPKAQFTNVLIHVEDTTLTVVFPENQEPYQLVVDINTTEELAGQPVTYAFVNFSYTDLFNISSSTGEIFVLKELDREEIKSYTLLVHGEVTSTGKRKKRAFGDDHGDIRVVIEVGDENDNVPTFSEDKLTFGLPRSSSFNYLIATLSATDLDEGNNSLIMYSISEGDTNILGIDPLSGEFRCISDISKTLINQLNAVINATDNLGQGHSVQVSVTIAVISDSDRAILVANQPASVMKKFIPDIQGNLSAILGFDVQVETVEPHTAYTESGSKVNPKMSDIYIHAIDPNTGHVVDHDALLRRLAVKDDEINEFFNKFNIKELIRLVVSHELYTMSLSEIALLCLAAVIFVGCILSIGVVIYSARQYDFERTRHQQATNARIKASELKTNPAYEAEENQFDNDSAEPLELTDLSAAMKKMVLYESQEITMDLLTETTSDYGDSSVSGEGQPVEEHGYVNVVLQEALEGLPMSLRGQPVGDSGNVTEVEIHSDKDSNSSQQSSGPVVAPSTSIGMVNPSFVHDNKNSAPASADPFNGEEVSVFGRPPYKPASHSPKGSQKGPAEPRDKDRDSSVYIHPVFKARRDSSQRSEVVTRL